MGGAESLYVLLSLVVCVGAVIALTGRWRPGVGLAVGGLLGTAVQWTTDAYLYGDAPLAPVAALLTVAVVVAVPPDGRGDGRLSAAPTPWPPWGGSPSWP